MVVQTQLHLLLLPELKFLLLSLLHEHLLPLPSLLLPLLSPLLPLPHQDLTSPSHPLEMEAFHPLLLCKIGWLDRPKLSEQLKTDKNWICQSLEVEGTQATEPPHKLSSTGPMLFEIPFVQAETRILPPHLRHRDPPLSYHLPRAIPRTLRAQRSLLPPFAKTKHARKSWVC